MAEKVGIIRAIVRYFRFWNWRKARYILNAADEQFTGSVDGIAAAFDIQKDSMVEQFQGLRDAVAQIEGVMEDKRSRLEKLNDRESELLQKREGALALAEKAQDANDLRELEKHSAAFERFENEIADIEQKQDQLKSEIEESSQAMDRYMLQLTEMQAEIDKLDQQKAGAIADFVSSKEIIALNDRLMNLQSSVDRGPIEAVLKANKDLTAKARVTNKLVGADTKVQDREYAKAGKTSTAKSKLEELLAARKAEKTAKSGEKPKDKDDRPKI